MTIGQEALFFLDWLLETAENQCAWCGERFGTDCLSLVQVDEVGDYKLLCLSCLEGIDQNAEKDLDTDTREA